MKKRAMLIAVALVVGIALAAYAGATKYALDTGPAGTTESGWVIVNNNPQKTIVNFQVDGLPVAAGQQYWAYYLDPPNLVQILGELKVNKKGSGHLNAHVAGGIPSGSYLGVANRDSPLPTSSQVVLFITLP